MMGMGGKAFEEGVKAALKFFRSPRGLDQLAKGAETVMKNLKNAARKASRLRRK